MQCISLTQAWMEILSWPLSFSAIAGLMYFSYRKERG
jgi:hypothetical protein